MAPTGCCNKEHMGATQAAMAAFSRSRSVSLSTALADAQRRLEHKVDQLLSRLGAAGAAPVAAEI